MLHTFTVQVSSTNLVRHYNIRDHSGEQALSIGIQRFKEETFKEPTGSWVSYEEGPTDGSDPKVTEDDQIVSYQGVDRYVPGVV